MIGDEIFESLIFCPTAKPHLSGEYGFYRRAGNGRARSLWYAVVRCVRVWRVRRG